MQRLKTARVPYKARLRRCVVDGDHAARDETEWRIPAIGRIRTSQGFKGKGFGFCELPGDLK